MSISDPAQAKLHPLVRNPFNMRVLARQFFTEWMLVHLFVVCPVIFDGPVIDTDLLLHQYRDLDAVELFAGCQSVTNGIRSYGRSCQPHDLHMGFGVN